VDDLATLLNNHKKVKLQNG